MSNKGFEDLEELKDGKNINPSPQPSPARGEGEKAAFTLAEVLITLGIIGVVAAMTMPAVVANHRKKEMVVKLEKAYSEISQALKYAEVVHGDPEHWDFCGATGSDHLTATKCFFENYLNLKYVKTCFPTSNNCWVTTKSLNGGFTGYYGNISSHGWGGYSSVITSSGYALYSQIATREVSNNNNIIIDVNGKRGPNTLGKDVFMFDLQLLEKPIFKIHWTNYNIEDIAENCQIENCQTTINGSNVPCGLGCGALIQQNGWKLPENYPY